MNFRYVIFLLLSFSGYFNYQIKAAGTGQTQAEKRLWLWFHAAKNRTIDSLRRLAPLVDINAQDENGNSALMHVASIRADQDIDTTNDIAKFLLQLPGIDINIENRVGHTALSVALQNRNSHLSDRLLQTNSIDVDTHIEAAEQQKLLLNLWFAGADAGNLEVIQKLISKVDINAQSQFHGSTALGEAVRRGHENLVKLLLQTPGINVNAGTWTPLMTASFQGRNNILKLLLQVPEININAHSEGQTALMLAISQTRGVNKTEIENTIKLLLQAPNINFNAQRKDGKTALMIAKESKDFNTAKLIEDKINELINKAINAIKDNNIEVFKSVVASIGIKLIDQNGDTILHKAIRHNRPEIARFILLTDFTLLDIANKDGQDPIELAVGYPEIFEVIKTLVPENSTTGSQSSVSTVKPSQLTKEADDLPTLENPCANCSQEHCTKKCARCKKVFYCSAECQKEHWKLHKQSCKAS